MNPYNHFQDFPLAISLLYHGHINIDLSSQPVHKDQPQSMCHYGIMVMKILWFSPV